MDMLEPWRTLSAENNEAFLETMLRLKLNTVNWDIHTFDKPYSIDKTTELIKKYGMVLTFHHHNPPQRMLFSLAGLLETVQERKAARTPAGKRRQDQRVLAL